ncbi:MAG: Rieske (2Fe-2S) protein [Acetobacterium woodii]|nr:Rieske (2Fe-2S) protein [Acetobacterium woodii]
MGYKKVAEIQEFDKTDKKLVVVNEQEILLTKIENGFYAISNKCPHMGGSLFKGTLEAGVVTCPRHGSKFDAKTGKAVGKPKILFLKFDVDDDRSYSVKLEDKDILIDVGE